MPQRNHLQNVIRDKTRRLQKLKEQQAREGQSTEPKILLEIEDLERELEILQEEYDSLPDVDEPEPAVYTGDAAQGSPRQEGSRQGGIHFGDHAQVQGDVFTDGKRVVNTGGGTYVGGNVDTGGGDFVGRDKVVHGDEIHGDKVGGDKITTGDISGTAALGRGAQATTTQGLSGEEIAKLFEQIYTQIDAKTDLSAEDKADLKVEVEEIQAAVTKEGEIDESFLSRRLRNIKRMAPDILDVVVATLANPVAGFGSVVTKIAKKMQESAS